MKTADLICGFRPSSLGRPFASASCRCAFATTIARPSVQGRARLVETDKFGRQSLDRVQFRFLSRQIFALCRRQHFIIPHRFKIDAKLPRHEMLESRAGRQARTTTMPRRLPGSSFARASRRQTGRNRSYRHNCKRPEQTSAVRSRRNEHYCAGLEFRLR
jgi:hypothetical protein